MTIIQSKNLADKVPIIVPGLKFVDEPCPRCGKPMYEKAASCFLRKRGFHRAVKCVKCGYQEGRK